MTFADKKNGCIFIDNVGYCAEFILNLRFMTFENCSEFFGRKVWTVEKRKFIALVRF